VRTGRFASPSGSTSRPPLVRTADPTSLPIFRGEGTARTDIDLAAAERLAETLPLPTFNADRRLQALDRMERE
jgi:tRNA (guanine-N7-)-methyltransferase